MYSFYESDEILITTYNGINWSVLIHVREYLKLIFFVSRLFDFGGKKIEYMICWGYAFHLQSKEEGMINVLIQ